MISVVVPTRRSSPDLKGCLESLSTQSKRSSEIIVVFDEKSDKNVMMARSFGARIFFDKHHTIGGAYSKGVEVATGDIIAFIDDDCVAPREWIKRLEDEFEEDIDVVGGEDIIPDDSTAFQKAAHQIDKARHLKSSIYGKKAKGRLRAANIAYRKTVFEKENFNPTLKGLQEPEFHHRIFKAGFKVKFDPGLYVFHKRRSGLRGIFNQIYRNGKAKINIIKLHKDMISFIDLVPFGYITITLLLAYLTSNLNTTFFYVWLAINLGYFTLKPFATILKTKEIKYYPYLVLIIFTREVAYSLGILVGLKSILKG